MITSFYQRDRATIDVLDEGDHVRIRVREPQFCKASVCLSHGDVALLIQVLERRLADLESRGHK